MSARRRVLFVPCFTGIPSHFITLVKLQQRLDPERFDTAFYVPKLTPAQVAAMPRSPDVDEAVYYYGGEFYSRFDVPMLDIDAKRGVSSEFAAYARFRPDVIVDDCSLITALTRQVRKVPRVAVLRAGAFADARGNGTGLEHSLQPLISAFRGMTQWGLPLPEKLADWFDAEAYVIPAIESIESNENAGVLPHLQDRTFYCGPLLLDEREELLFQSQGLQDFVAANAQRRIAYVTFGIVAVKDAPEAIVGCLRHLYDNGFAVITNLPALATGGDGRCFHARAVPMHYVCSKADLVIHVSGSAAYHYPIIHGKPAITIGTQSCDREATAHALQSAGLTRHLPYADAPEFVRTFHEAIDDYLAARYPFDVGLAARLATHLGDVERTVRNFDFARVIETALVNVGRLQASVN